MPSNPSTTIEAFLTDPAFVDSTRAINDILTNGEGKVASLTKKAISYFNDVSIYSDKRDPTSRTVGWYAETSPRFVVDGEVYSSFVDTINAQTEPVSNGFFKLLDALLFNYTGSLTHSEIEALLVADTEISEIYVPGSFVLSTSVLPGDIFYASGSTDSVNVPTQTTFSIILPTGSTTTTYVLTVFTSVDAWLTGYNISTVEKVIPPLSYATLYSASLTNTEANVFSTAALSTSLSYTTTRELIGSESISGITEYNAVLVDTDDNSVAIPFNVLYKGRAPTLTEIRESIKADLLSCGVGNEAGWEARIPGVFVSGRFYLIPLWDLTYQKPDAIVYPSIVAYGNIVDRTNKVMTAGGYSDVFEHTDILPAYYNKMTVVAVPDLTSAEEIVNLNTIVPDYQSYPTTDENFNYMTTSSQAFSTNLNTILAIDTTAGDPGIYGQVTENLLTFYSFVVQKYEMCVITKQCYTDIMESSQ